MDNLQDFEIILPEFVIDSEIAFEFQKQWPDYPKIIENVKVIFVWSDVCFFDDYTLLKLVIVQRKLRIQGCRVCNIGFKTAYEANKIAVIKQLWDVGLPELTASGHLISQAQLKDVLEDDRELLNGNPIQEIHSPTIETAVIPMLCCHDHKHFTTGSREEKQLDSFIRTCLRASDDDSWTWDLVENREFRHKMLQQLRHNVHEHSRAESEDAIGLAIVRIWRNQSLSDEWALSKEMQEKLLLKWKPQPIPTLLSELKDQNGIIQISVVDDGGGIPAGLKGSHDKILLKTEQHDLFVSIRYDDAKTKDTTFNVRFKDPVTWDEKHRLIAFATDKLGTSKINRANELKGLEYLRETAVVAKKGVACIESDGAALSNFSQSQEYGRPQKIQLGWCEKGGTGICLAVPIYPEKSTKGSQKILPLLTDLKSLTSKGVTATERLRIKDYLNQYQNHASESDIESNKKCLDDCIDVITEKVVLLEIEENVHELRKKGLLIIDWGELHESKPIFNYLLIGSVKRLSIVNPRQMRPFVYANMPKGLCALIAEAIGEYSKHSDALPVCVFTAERDEPFWLGLDSDRLIPVKYIFKNIPMKFVPHKITDPIKLRRRKLIDIEENGTEAFFRDYFSQLLDNLGEPISKYDSRLLRAIHQDYQSTLRQDKDKTLEKLFSLVERSALFREEKQSYRGEEIIYTGKYQPVFTFGEIKAEIRALFLGKFREVFTSAPVCFTPPNEDDGVQLLHSTRVVRQYFRSDALLDSPIAMELTEELTSIAFDIARQMPSGRIDWVVSCTSPLHWFVHKIIDGLAEFGMICSHHIFTSYEEIPTSLNDVRMRSGETVLVFTDVIASGQTSYRMANSLINRFNVKMAGLIALADIRRKSERNDTNYESNSLEKIFDGRIVCLYNESEPDIETDSKELKATYYIHPETVVPKFKDKNPEKDFFDINFSGTGPLVEMHPFFSNAKHTLELMTKLEAVRFGHFQHGSHHSEVFVDVEKVLMHRKYRSLVVTALFRYIVAYDIHLVLYPNHSSAYLLADDLKQRFANDDPTVEFLMACRTFQGRGTKGTSYALTRFSPHPDSYQWNKFSNNSVLILDDAVCSGTTVESIIAELVRIDTDYYGNRSSQSAQRHSDFSVHVVAFLNRLPRATGDFWKGLPKVAVDKVYFSTFIRMPIAADSEELCPQCRLKKELKHALNSKKHCLYTKEFIRWWLSDVAVVSSHERRHFDHQPRERFSSADALSLAGYHSAIERKGYDDVRKKLFSSQTSSSGDETAAVRIHVRCRAGFLYGLFPRSTGQDDIVLDLCNEIEKLIDMTLDKNQVIVLYNELLEILQILTQRYMHMRPAMDEVKRVMCCLLQKLAFSFDDRLVVGGISSVLDTCLNWYATPDSSEMELKDIRNSIRKAVSNIDRNHQSGKAALMLDWLNTYLAEGGENINSVGEAVMMLADFAKKGRPYHFYGRYEVDGLAEKLQQPIMGSRADDTPEIIRRTNSCMEIFSKLVRATRVLQSASSMDEEELNELQNFTEENILELRKLCKKMNSDNIDELLATNKRIREIYLFIYNKWFPSNGQIRSKAVDVIEGFTPSLNHAVITAWDEFTPVKLNKENIDFSMNGLTTNCSVNVLIDPNVLNTTLNQLFDNIDKFSLLAEPVKVICQIQLPAEDINNLDDNTKIADDQVGLVISNTGTSRVDINHIKYHGLIDVKRRLSEYGGSLNATVPESDFTFKVVTKLNVWIEGKT